MYINNFLHHYYFFFFFSFSPMFIFGNRTTLPNFRFSIFAFFEKFLTLFPKFFFRFSQFLKIFGVKKKKKSPSRRTYFYFSFIRC